MSHPNNPTVKPDLQVHAARLREMAEYEQRKSEEWSRQSTSIRPESGYSHAACHRASQSAARSAAALLAGAAALERAAWRPISEAHEDLGPLILIDIEDPGYQVAAHVCDLDWHEEAKGMTHFAQLPTLTIEMADDLLEALKHDPE